MRHPLFLSILFLITANYCFSQQMYFDWGVSTGTTFGEGVSCLDIDESNNVYVVGTYSDTIDLDPGPGVDIFPSHSYNNQGGDMFVFKLDSAGNYIWGKSIGDTDGAYGRQVIYDTSGYIYVAGEFRNEINVDPGLTNTTLYCAGLQDIFVQKLDLDGNHIWAKAIHGYGVDDVGDLAIDHFGHLVLTGTIGDSIWFDAPYMDTLAPHSYPYDDAIILKMHPSNGHIVWAKNFGGPLNESGLGVQVDLNDDVIITGFYEDSCDLDPDTLNTYWVTEYSDRSPYVLKLSTTGNFIWGKAMVGHGYTIGTQLGGRGRSIVTNSENDIYIAGYFSDTVDFNPDTSAVYELYAHPSMDGYVQKLDSAGNFEWVIQLGKPYGYEQIQEIAIDQDENIYFTGAISDSSVLYSMSDTIVMETTGGIMRDVFCIKLDSLGNYLWDQKIGGNNPEWGQALAVGIDNSVFLGGQMGTDMYDQGLCDLDPGTTEFNVPYLGLSDIFVVKLNECTDSLGTAPTPLLATLPDLYDECSLILTAPQASHSCAGLITAIEANSTDTISTQGAYTVEWIFDDGYGNTTSQFQNVVINDTTAPVPDLVTLPIVIASCDTSVTVPLAYDNCSGVIIGTTTDPTSFSGQGTFNIQWVYDDLNGNVLIQNQTVIINDTVTPVLDTPLDSLFSECPPFTVNSPTATDNCAGTIIASTTDPLTYSNQGVYSILWEFDDGNGNSLYQTQVVEISTIDDTYYISNDTLFANAIGNYTYQWMDCSNWSPIGGATGSFYVPGDYGSYAVNIYNGTCSVFTDCFGLQPDTTAVNELHESIVSLAPNPVEDILTIRSTPNLIGTTINIVDGLGKIVLPAIKVISVEQKLTLDKLSAGVYFVSIENGQLFRFVKE